jgi:hypothetical protein
MMEAVRTSETSVDNHFTRQYNPEDSSEHHYMFCVCVVVVVVVVITVANGNAVKGYCAVWDNIFDYMCLLP